MQKRSVLPLLLCLASFGLGVMGLGQKSLWGDEAYSWWASQQSAVALLGGLDAQPPLYHLLLGVQRIFGGDTEFSLRFLSVLCGVLGVAFVWRGSSAQSARSVLTAGFITAFVAFAPIMVYFQQEVRMYALAAMFTAAAISQTIILLTHKRASWLALTLFSLGALFTHFYGVGILLVNALALFLYALRQKSRRVMGQWLVAHLAIAGVFGGWFFGLQWRYLGRSAGGRGRIFATPDEMLSNAQRGINGLILGLRAQPELAFISVMLFALALLGGVLMLQNRTTRKWAALGFAWIAASFGLVLLTASPGAIVPDFNPRYLIFTITPLAILTGGWFTRPKPAEGRKQLGFAIPAAVAIMLGMGFGYGNILQYSPNWQKSGYRELLQTIRQWAQAGDVAVLLNSDQYPHYAYYGPTNTPIWLMSNELYAQPAQASTMLNNFLAQNAARRVWLVSYGGAATMRPLPQPTQDLNKLWARVYQQGFQDATLGLYVLLDGSDDMPATPLNSRFGNAIQLTGIRLRTPQVSAGDTLSFDLIWKAIGKPNADYTVFVHIMGDGIEQIAALDSPPRNGERPTSTWNIGEVIPDTRGIPIPQNAKPGEYDIVVGFYSYPSFERLHVDGDETQTQQVVGTFVISK